MRKILKQNLAKKKILFLLSSILIIVLTAFFSAFNLKNNTVIDINKQSFIDKAFAGELKDLNDIKKNLKPEKKKYTMALVADAHVSEETYAEKEKIIEILNGWNDINSVSILGDSCSQFGTEKEYALIEKYFNNLKLPKYFITGNHEFFYKDGSFNAGKNSSEKAIFRTLKLRRFKNTFGLDSIYYSRNIENYLFIFLSVDALDAQYSTTLSENQLNWLSQKLAANKEVPTIILCHAPLYGTFRFNHKVKNINNSVIQPAEKIRDIIKDNPQIFIWIAGHKHIKAASKDYNSPVNIYENQVTCIHTSAIFSKKKEEMAKSNAWINTLTLSEDYVLVKTYDCKNKKWLSELERKIVVPEKYKIKK